MVLITFTDEENLAGYVERNRLPFTVVTDRDREGYRAFGLDRGSVRRVWGWRAGLRYLELLWASANRYGRSLRRDRISALRSGGGRLRRPTEDTLQLGGDFVIGPDGVVAYAFRGAGPDDRPEVETLVAAVRGLA